MPSKHHSNLRRRQAAWTVTTYNVRAWPATGNGEAFDSAIYAEVDSRVQFHDKPWHMKVQPLPDVMLCAASSIALDETIAALERSCSDIAFGDVVLFSDVDPKLSHASPVRWVRIPRLTSKEEYSAFILKDLRRHVSLPFVLILQWDSFVLNPGNWDDAFSRYDYIGAPWPQFQDGMTVGNGGFSLRSRRLLDTIASDEFPLIHPEDTAICRHWRPQLERLSIRFAPSDVALRFSFERSPFNARSFGFHGLFNFPDALSKPEVMQHAKRLPAQLLFSRDGRDFIMALADKRWTYLALLCLARRIRHKPLDFGNAKLALRLTARAVKGRLHARRSSSNGDLGSARSR